MVVDWKETVSTKLINRLIDNGTYVLIINHSSHRYMNVSVRNGEDHFNLGLVWCASKSALLHAEVAEQMLVNKKDIRPARVEIWRERTLSSPCHPHPYHHTLG